MQGRVTVPNSILLTEVSNLLAEGSRVMLLTKGASMRPFIEGGRDSVELVLRDSYKVGDIVLAKVVGDRFVLHRIISVGEKVVLKGDGNLVGTEVCLDGGIAGAVERIVHPDGSYVDCTSRRFERRSRRWGKAPYIVRRVVLGIMRRLVKLHRNNEDS